MTSYRNHIVSDRDRSRALAEMANALSTMEAIMREKAVTDQRGCAYTDDDTMVLQAGREALDRVVANPQGNAARLINEQRMAVAGRAVDRADMMLSRDGFTAVKDLAWTDADRQVIDKALELHSRVTAHSRN